MNFFVTGGSRGIGEAIVLEAVRQGHDVAFTYVSNEKKAHDVVAEAKKIDANRKVKAYQLDVRDSAATQVVADSVLDDFDTIHVVVPNAGINANNLAANMTDDEWRIVIDTNLTGAFFTVRQFLPTMIGNRYGRIIFISSLGWRGVSGQANYSASKAALMGLSMCLAKEYGKRGITSNVVVPGFFDTDMTREHMSDANREFWLKYCPTGRIGRADEVAHMVMYLASKDAAYVSGQDIALNGGLDWAP